VWEAEDIKCPKELQRFRIKNALKMEIVPSALLMPRKIRKLIRLDYGRSPHAYINQRLQIQLELLMMSGVSLETC
jgi:hypothetical protein